MARAYKIEAANGAIRYAGSTTAARAARDELLEQYPDLRKKDVSIDEQVELPTKKDELIDFLNELLAEYDPSEEEEEEN